MSRDRFDDEDDDGPTIHACAVLVGARAVLIRGPSGSGKSRLALALIEAARTRAFLPFARLVADDRVRLDAASGTLLAYPANSLAGLIEIRNVGIETLPYEAVAAVGWVVDLAAPDADRLPPPESRTITIRGVSLPRLALPDGVGPLGTVLAFFRARPLTSACAPLAQSPVGQ